jgi:hypothetical protein
MKQLAIHWKNLPPKAPFVDTVVCVMLATLYDSNFIFGFAITFAVTQWIGFFVLLKHTKVIDIFETVEDSTERTKAKGGNDAP